VPRRPSQQTLNPALTISLISTVHSNNKLHRDRHVILPKELAKTLPKTRLLSENEWRSIGVQQSRGWQHYAIHRPEPHILLFRRPLGTDPQTGAIDPELKRMALEEYKGQFGLRGN
jgi:cyclin-dependent kinase regulatory subunit CKS1